jgi:hypothetical protein
MVTHVLEENTSSVFRAKLEKPGFSETLDVSIRMCCVIFQKPIMLKHTAVRIPVSPETVVARCNYCAIQD